MTKVEFNSIVQEIVKTACAQMEKWPELRYGQCIFNIAEDFFPAEVNAIRGDLGKGGKDPFYQDSNLQNFWEYLESVVVDEQ